MTSSLVVRLRPIENTTRLSSIESQPKKVGVVVVVVVVVVVFAVIFAVISFVIVISLVTETLLLVKIQSIISDILSLLIQKSSFKTWSNSVQ